MSESAEEKEDIPENPKTEEKSDAVELKPKSQDFEDDLSTWDRYKEAMFREQDSIHLRLQWLFLPQSVLLAAFGLTLYVETEFTEIEILTDLFRLVVVMLGLLSSLTVSLAVGAATSMHEIWSDEMRKIAKHHPTKLSYGTRSTIFEGMSRHCANLIPPVFIFAWMVLGLIMLTNMNS